jgi:hypothetical protein
MNDKPISYYWSFMFMPLLNSNDKLKGLIELLLNEIVSPDYSKKTSEMF